MPQSRRAAAVVGVQDIRRMADVDLSGAGMIDPDRVAAVLAGAGLEVTDVTLVLADVPLPGPRAGAAAERGQTLAQSQLELLESSRVPTRLLSSLLTRFDDGPTPQWAEVGTDGLLVVAALQRALDAGAPDGPDAVVVVSDDPDLRVVHRYPTGCPIVYVGNLGEADRADLAAVGGRHTSLPAAAFAAMLVGGPEPPHVPPVDCARLREDEVPSPERERMLASMRDRGSVAVLDAYDVMRQAMGALGAARLPAPDGVRAVMAHLHAAEPTVLAAIPRIRAELLNESPAGWRVRDRQFGELEAAYELDPDAAGNLGELMPPTAERSHLGQRRLVTQVLADAYWALRTCPATTPVFVFADLWDVPVLQWHLRGLGVDRPERLVRIGATPLTIERAGVSQVVLPDHLLARLVAAPGSLGRRRHLALGQAVTDAPGRQWRIVDVAPEDDAVVVAPLDAPDALTLAPAEGDVGDVIVMDDLAARLATPHSVVPRLLPTATAPPLRHGWVVSRDEPTAVLVDLDGDGRPDVAALTPHDLAGFRPYEQVTLQHSATGLLYVGPAEPADGPADPGHDGVLPVEIAPATEDGRVLAEHDGERLEVRLLPGTRALPGDRVLAVLTDQPRRLLAISTPLPGHA